MTIYSGETIFVSTTLTNPITKTAITQGTVVAEFFNPTKHPDTTVADRTSPDYTATLTYDSTAKAWTGTKDTTGWTAGSWTMRIKVTGTYSSFEFFTFDISL